MVGRRSEDPESVTGEDGATGLLITVVRSGGITGAPRTWTVAPPPAESPNWALLIERCPWGNESSTQRGADRFVWRIRVQLHDDQHEQVVSDANLSGPWRELVDAVRAAGSPRPAST
ncbi:protealysin inhibitor emfourin [Microbacterium nymphoidis]|uniref:protealysin inhibitor emfourin n=1 Tax=Microbacterium nymphoidis TaxID=2898586 RepID=UPI0027E0CAE6|nr:protealysin inhibitor emfourin [Microbacterium nymphoidis]